MLVFWLSFFSYGFMQLLYAYYLVIGDRKHDVLKSFEEIVLQSVPNLLYFIPRSCEMTKIRLEGLSGNFKWTLLEPNLCTFLSDG